MKKKLDDKELDKVTGGVKAEPNKLIEPPTDDRTASPYNDYFDNTPNANGNNNTDTKNDIRVRG